MFEYYYYRNYDHARTTSVTTATWTASSCCTRSPIASRTTTSPTCWLVYSAVTATRRPPSYLPPTRPTSCASDRSPTEVREPNYYRPHRSIGCGLLLHVRERILLTKTNIQYQYHETIISGRLPAGITHQAGCL